MTEADEGPRRRGLLSRVASEPLVRFALLGVLAFAAHRWLARREADEATTIRVDTGAFGGVPADAGEREAAIEAYVREEVLFREARTRGLGEGDAIVRRRLIEKMRTLLEAEVAVDEPTDAELDAYRTEHAERFERPARVAFEHRFFARSRRGDEARADAETALERLRRGQDVAGDPFLLGTTVPLSPASQVRGSFGAGFAERVDRALLDAWDGPIDSSYGVHLVRVTTREPKTVPSLATIRDRVETDYRRDAIEGRVAERLRELARGYQVIREDRR